MRIADGNLAIIDTESTGLDYATGDRVVQIAVVRLSDGGTFTSLVNPKRSIPATASAVHHLIDADVASAPEIDEIVMALREWLGSDAVLWAHNAAFDSSMLPQLADLRWGCTKRLAQHLIDGAPAYSNQVLRYHLALDRDALRGVGVHEALGDALVTTHLLRVLIERYLAAGHPDDVNALLAFAAAPIAYTHWPFGKYRNRPIAVADSGYLRWTLEKSDLDADLRATLVAESSRRFGHAVSA